MSDASLRIATGEPDPTSGVRKGKLAALWSPGRVAVAAFAIAVLLFPVLSESLYYQNLIILAMVLAAGAVGMNVITGFAGYVSLGQGAFVGVGGYAVAILNDDFGGSIWVWIPIAGLVAALVALVLGVVAMRTRGASFAILSISFLLLVQLLAVNLDGLTNGSTGITLPLPTWSDEYAYWPFYYALFGILAASLLMTWWIRRSKLGIGLLAIREDEDKAATVGVNTAVYKMLAFVASALFAGMAGGVYGYYVTFVDPRGMFNILFSLQIVLALLLGGRGTIFGPVLGAFLITWVSQFANNDLGGGNTRLLVLGGLLVVVVLFLPRGIIPSAGALWRRFKARGGTGIVGRRLDGAIELAVRDVSAPAPTSGAPLLEVKGLSKSFAGLHAVNDCSFSVPEGSITGLIGPNGSGKTTVFNLIDGMLQADGGEVWLDGQRLDGKSAPRRAHAGLARTFQITRLFPEMTVLENVVAPLRSFQFRQLAAPAVSGAEASRAEEILDYVGMRRYRNQTCDALSYGQQKLVELAQVLMLEPKLILLDEPAGGINPTLIERLGEMIQDLNAQGMTFLIVEHNMPFVLGLCDPVLVLARGTTIASGTAQAVQRDPLVLDAYLGDDFSMQEKAE